MVASSAVGAIPAGVVVGGLVYRVPARHLIGGGLLVGALGAVLTLLLTPDIGPLLGAGRAAGWVVPGVILTGPGLGAVMTAASAAITGGAPPHRAGMASSVEEVSFELGGLTGVAVLGSVLTAVYTATVDLPAGAPEAASDSIDEVRAVAGELPPDGSRSLLESAASAFDNGYTLTLVITVAVLAAGGVAARLLLGHRAAAAAPEDETAGDGPGVAGAVTGTPPSPR
ncbi:hypothetical protein OG946_11840 [Streptomyces sp. NBC_01808]|uniref:hypothetical protein n=1 Tax=Streptomyces sp. NBC_01808 TaxID=2975947 RepID=UPI002DDA0E4E|nr:hypothetical protein [Streptomyces sp. NBC_01808]WSA38008.1 hypothetical protein OG946_11840 [Streptomyces sp. NBC_01808]